MQRKPPYKTANNRWFTRALFWDQYYNIAEADKPKDIDPVFTLYYDRPGLINARKTFVELGDPTGYKWAQQYLTDYDHWQYLMKAKWFRDAVEDWILELNAKLLSEALDSVRRVARSENDSQALAAAKYLAERPWDKKEKGRPSKVQIEANIKQEARKRTEEDDDMARIGLKVV